MATFLLGPTTVAGHVLLGVDRRGDHCLLVPVPPEIPTQEDRRSAFVQVVRSDLVLDGSTRTYAAVVCHRRDLDGLFDDVLAAMLAELADQPTDPAGTCIRVLSEWRELLRKNAGVLGESALRGLFGELLVLERIIKSHSSVAVADLWRGPDLEPHDFNLGGHVIEVKTLGHTGSIVEIHGLDQLQAPPRQELYLILVRLAEDMEGRSLPELIDAIAKALPNPGEFREQLAKAGYSAADAQAYRDRRFLGRQVLGLQVTSGFPSIVHNSFASAVPPEIRGVTYTIDLVEYLPEAWTDDDLERVFCMN
jgi:hypothetical protein